MATTNPPPRLQIAQVLADLSGLNVADPDAALSLVTAPQHLHISSQKPARSTTTTTTTTNNNNNNNNNKANPSLSTSSSHISQDGSSSSHSRRRSGPASPPALTPGTLSRTLSRNDSTGSGMSGSGAFERYMTPSPGDEADPDLERAGTLMHLYEIRSQFVQQDSGGLARARANVEAVAERYGRLG